MPDSSREEIAKLEALYANNPAGRVFTHLAEAYRKAGEFERARGILEEGLQKHPGYASAYVVLGRVLTDLQDSDGAAGAFRQVLDLDPHNLVALRSLGELARGAGHTEDALRYFEELRQHDPSNDEIEQIINELGSSAEQGTAEYPDAADQPAVTELRSVTVEFEAEAAVVPGWKPEPRFFEPVPDETEELPPEPAEVQTESPAVSAAEPEPEPWTPDYAEPAQDVTPEAAHPFEQGMVTEDLQLGWVQPEPEPEPMPVADELGDLTTIGQATEQFAVEGETFMTEDLDLGVGEPQIAFEPAADEPAAEGEVLTETIAELYRRQGLYERSVEVYRALLRESPDNADLQAKLAEVEALAQAPIEREPASVEPEPAAAEHWSEPEPWEAIEQDAEDAAVWLTGGVPTAESTPTPYAWTEQSAEVIADTGRPIGVYFRELLAWQPRAAAPPGSEASTAAEAFDEWFGGSEPSTADAASAQAATPESDRVEPRDSEAGDDDDDLEMFRSWLQSLRK